MQIPEVIEPDRGLKQAQARQLRTQRRERKLAFVDHGLRIST